MNVYKSIPGLLECVGGGVDGVSVVVKNMRNMARAQDEKNEQTDPGSVSGAGVLYPKLDIVQFSSG